MSWFIRLVEKLDFAVSVWERAAAVPWIGAGVPAVIFCLFKIWAEVSGQPLVIQATIALLAAAAATVLFLSLPTYLRKVTRPSFQVSVPMVVSSPHDIQMQVSIINRSPRRRLVLDFAVCVRSADRRDIWFLKPEIKDINQGLGPEEHTEGMIACSSFHNDLPHEPIVSLQVTDRISLRKLFFKVPN